MSAKLTRSLLVVAIVAVASQAATAAITPPMITNLKAWYQPSTLSGPPLTPVTAWTDSSGNGFHLSATGTFNPTIVRPLGLNNHRGVHFVKSVSDPLTRALFNNSATSSMFVVAQVTSTSATYNVWIDGQANRQTMYHYNNEYSMFAGVEQRDVLAGAGGTNDLLLHRYMATWNGANSVGGVDGLESGLVNPSNQAIGTIVVGDHTSPGDGNDATVNIAEVIIYDRVLNATERAQIDEYLFEKYFVLAPAVPEPSTLVLAGMGLVGLLIRHRRRRVM